MAISLLVLFASVSSILLQQPPIRKAHDKEGGNAACAAAPAIDGMHTAEATADSNRPQFDKMMAARFDSFEVIKKANVPTNGDSAGGKMAANTAPHDHKPIQRDKHPSASTGGTTGRPAAGSNSSRPGNATAPPLPKQPQRGKEVVIKDVLKLKVGRPDGSRFEVGCQIEYPLMGMCAEADIGPELRDFLQSAGVTELEVSEEMLVELRRKEAAGEFSPSAHVFDLDQYMAWLTVPPRPGQPSRLTRLLDGFDELEDVDDNANLFYQELSRRAIIMPALIDQGRPVHRMAAAIREARRWHFAGSLYLVWSRREAYTLLASSLWSTAGGTIAALALLLLACTVTLVWREVQIERADLGEQHESIAQLVLSSAGIDYLLSMGRWVLWGGQVRPSLSRFLHRYQPAQQHWWDAFIPSRASPATLDLADVEDDGRQRMSTRMRTRKSASFTPSLASSSSSEEDNDGAQHHDPLQFLIQQRTRQHRQKPVASSSNVKGGTSGGATTSTVAADASKTGKKPVVIPLHVKPVAAQPITTKQQVRRPIAATISSSTTAMHTKPIADVFVQPAVSFKDALDRSLLPSAMATSSSTKKDEISSMADLPPGLDSASPDEMALQRRKKEGSKRAVRKRSRLLPFIMEEEEEEDDMLDGRSSRSTSTVSNGSETASGIATPSFSLFSHYTPSYQQSGTDTPADSILLEALLRRRQPSLDTTSSNSSSPDGANHNEQEEVDQQQQPHPQRRREDDLSFVPRFLYPKRNSLY